MVRCKIKLVKSKKPSITTVRDRTREFKVTLQNKFALLNGKNEDSIDTLNGSLTTAITESAAASGEAARRKQTGKLTWQTKELIARLKSMVDQTEIKELSKVITTSKTSDVHEYNMAVVEKTLQMGGSLKATARKLAVGRDRM